MNRRLFLSLIGSAVAASAAPAVAPSPFADGGMLPPGAPYFVGEQCAESFIEAKAFSVEEICRVFAVPVEMILELPEYHLQGKRDELERPDRVSGFLQLSGARPSADGRRRQRRNVELIIAIDAPQDESVRIV